MDGVEPCFGKSRPVGNRQLCRAQAIAVAAFGKDVQLGWNLRFLQRMEVKERVFYVDGIVFGLDEEGGRRVGGGVDSLGEGIEGRTIREVGRIDDDGEVWARIRLGGGFSSSFVVGVIAEDDSEMRTGGEAQDADTIGVDPPFGGVSASDPHGSLGVFEVGGILRVVVGKGNTILHQDAGHADGVEPGTYLGAFKVVGEKSIAATGKDEDRGTRILRVFRTIKSERGRADVCEAYQRFSGSDIGGPGDVMFRAAGVRLRRAVGPERQSDLLRGGEGRRSQESDRKQQVCTHAAMVIPCAVKPE